MACELTFLKSYHFTAYDTIDGENCAIGLSTHPNPYCWREEESSVTIAPEGCVKESGICITQNLLIYNIQIAMYKENSKTYEESFIRYFITVTEKTITVKSTIQRQTLKVVKTGISDYTNVLRKQKSNAFSITKKQVKKH